MILPDAQRNGGRLADKRCLITAAGQGIGRETALAFAREGARVLATDVNGVALDQLTQEEPAVEVARLDVCDPAAVKALAGGGGPFDAVFNCAGYVHQGTLLDTSDEEWRRSFDINVDAMFRVCRAVLPEMLANGRGSIINMSSVASSIKGVPNRFAYGVTKAAVIGLTKALAADYVGQGVRCNAICPGTVITPSLRQRVEGLPGDVEANWKSFTARQPMGRLGRPEEIAALAVYLASDESAFTTGVTHVIDGGWSI